MSTVYVEYLECMLTDHGSVFLFKEWKYNCEESQIHLNCIGTESHNSLGIREMYISALRTIYSKVMCDQLSLPGDLALAKSAQAKNETTGPNGSVPSLKVFGALLKLPKISLQKFPRQKRDCAQLKLLENSTAALFQNHLYKER